MRSKSAKILVLILCIALLANINFRFDTESDGHFLQLGQEVNAAALYSYDKYTINGPYVLTYLSYDNGSNFGSDVYGYPSYTFDRNTGGLSFSGTLQHYNGLTQTVYEYSGGLFLKKYSYRVDGYGIYWCTEKYVVTGPVSESKGYLVQSGIIALDGAYPDNGKFTDGYWYVKTTHINQGPSYSVVLPSQNETLSDLTNYIPSMTVSDPDGDELTCKYYIDGMLKETKNISNTATAQIVKFSTLDVVSLTEGAVTFKYEISDGMAPAVTTTSSVTVDIKPPVISTVNATTNDTGVTISGSATENISNPIQYRYTVGSNVSSWTTSSSITVGDLTPNTQYNVKFEAKDAVGHIAEKQQTVYTKAQVPQISILNQSKTTADLEISDSNPSTTEYQIMVDGSYVDSNGDLSATPQWIIPTDKKITVNGLDSNNQYTVKAKARNAEQDETAFSSEKTATTKAQAPNNISFQKATNSITVNWSALTGATTGYDIEVDGEIQNLGEVTSYTHEGLQPETTHNYRVRAKNAAGDGDWSELVSSTTYPNPPAVPQIGETDQTQTEITITFDAVAKATKYEIEADGKIKTIEANGSTQYTYKDTNLTPDTTHTYKIRAINDGGASSWSEEKQITTYPNVPEVPSNIKNQPTRINIKLTWDEAQRAEGYDIEIDGSIQNVGNVTSYTNEGLKSNTIYTFRIRGWNRGGKGEWSEPIQVKTWPELPAVPGNIMATTEKEEITISWNTVNYAESYDIQIDEGEIHNVEGTSYTHTGLKPGSKHTYRIRAKNIGGQSEWSNTIQLVTTPEEIPQSQDPQEPKPTTQSPLVNVAAIVTNKTVTLTWQAAGTNVQYEVEVDEEIIDNGKDTTYTHTGLDPESFHTYRVRVKDPNGNSQWCGTLALTTLPNPPTAPVNILVTPSNTQIELTWTKEEGTDYEIEVDGTVIDVGNVSSYIHSGLKPGSTHNYRIRGKNITATTAWSEKISKTTISPTNQITCKNGQTFNYTLVASNVKDFNGMKYVISYNPDELEIVDLCDITTTKETTSGKIPGTNLTVTYTEGKIEFTVNESITSGKTWSGEICTVIFKSKVGGTVSIDFVVK